MSDDKTGTTDTDDDLDTGADDDAPDDKDDDGKDALGDAGKKALDAMKAARTAARKERDEAKAELAKAKAELAKAQAGKAGDDKKLDVDEKAIRDEARAEARAEALKERALDRIEAKAGKLFADPEDARALLASKVDDFIDDGEIDSEAIAQALADLLKKKPHLGAQGAGKRFETGADGGARKGSNGPAQLTEQDLKRMTPQQIEKARVGGQLNKLLGVD